MGLSEEGARHYWLVIGHESMRLFQRRRDLGLRESFECGTTTDHGDDKGFRGSVRVSKCDRKNYSSKIVVVWSYYALIKAALSLL